MVNEFEDEINGFTFTIDNFETVEEIFSNSSDDILFQTSDDGEFAFVFDVTGGSNLTALEKQSIFSASITKDANGLSSFNADLEISFVGSEILEKQEFVFNFDERNYIDGAINLSGTETKYIFFMPGDVNNSLNDITVYELI